MRRAKKTMRKPSKAMRKAKSKSAKVSKKAMRRTKRPKKSTKKKSKGKKGPTDWNTHLMKVYKEMKAKDSKVRFGDAMKAAKKTYKKAPASKWMSVPTDDWQAVTKKAKKH